MAAAIPHFDPEDKDGIMDYLQTRLSKNPEAVMYYFCLGYDGGVFPADHSSIDLDPTTRGWWKSAMEKKGLIYTEPYVDFATGQMILTIAEPVDFPEYQACVLADISIDSLVEQVNGISSSKNLDSFLLAGDGSVVVHYNQDFLPSEEGNTILSDKVSLDLEEGKMKEFTDYDHMEKYLVAHELSETGWILGIVKEKKVIADKIIYNNILMVYAQRPGATLVADYDTWKKVGRYVRRGSKRIAIFPSKALKPYMRQVFDIGDTGGRSREDAGAGCGAADQRQHTLCRVYQVRAGDPAGGARLRDHRGPER